MSETHYIAQTGLELTAILLTPPSKYFSCRRDLPLVGCHETLGRISECKVEIGENQGVYLASCAINIVCDLLENRLRYLGDFQVGFSPPHLISRLYYVIVAVLKVKGQR